MAKVYRKILPVLLFFLSQGISHAQCTATVTLFQSCTTNGGYQVIIPASCPTTTGTVIKFTNVAPVVNCPSITQTIVPGPGTYSCFFNSAPLFCGANYAIRIFSTVASSSVNSNAIYTNLNILPPSTANYTFQPISQSLPSCSNSCNGSVVGNVYDLNYPVSLTLTPFGAGTPTVITGITSSAINVTLSGLCSGDQTVAVTNSIGCIHTSIFNMDTTARLGVIKSFSNPNCNTSNNGCFSVAPLGGTPNYTVVFSNAQTFTGTAGSTVVATNLSGGVITATITDANGCFTSASATIVTPSSIIVVPTQTNVNCFGSNNGSGSVSVSGGGGTFNYTWTPVSGSTAVNNNLTAGAHTVFILDNFNCLTQQTFSITQPNSITIVQAVNNITCNASCNGSATVTVSGPTAAVNYTWSTFTGSVISNTNSVGSLCAGLYTVSVHDVSTPNSCVTNSVITITQPTLPIVTNVTTQSISCLTNTCTGTATSAPSGGNGGPFTYTWMPGSLTGSSVNSLCAQNYTLTVRDASGCVNSSTFSINQPSLITPAVTQTNVTCAGSNNGVITASPSGGLAPYTYTLVSSTTTNVGSPPFTNLTAGTYSLLIKDNSSATCPQVTTVTLTAPNTLSASITQSNLTCATFTNGFLSSTPIGGNGPSYTHTWSTASGTFFTPSASNLAPGPYTYFLKDAIGCTYSVAGTLTAPPAFTLTINSTPVSCFSATNGVLSANISGGTPGYAFNWLPNNFNANPNPNLGAGIYTLTITDANNCTLTRTASVASPSAIILSFTTAPTLCAGSANGSATVLATGGTSPYVYSFNTSPVTTNTTGVANTFSVGSFVATVTDANACVQSTVLTISAPPALSASVTTIKNSCTACTGGATVTPAGGSPGYTFVWTNSLSATVSTVSGPSGLCPGPYTVTVFDSHLCASPSTVSITQVVFSALPSSASVQCFGACNASVVVSPVGGVPPYTYTWTPSAQNTQTATNLCGNITYTVQVKESGSSACVSTTFVTVTSPASLTVNSTATNPTCFGLANGIITTTMGGGTSPYSYTWSPGGQNTSSLSAQNAGTFAVTIEDVNGCTLTPQNYTLTQSSSVSATFVKTLPSSCTSANGVICASPSGGSGAGYTYTWIPVPGGLNCLSNIPAGNYTLILGDGAGCTQTLATNLNSPSGPSVTAVTQSVSCFGSNTGGATLTTVGNGPFNYTWSPAVAGNVSAIATMTAGIYTVTAMDINSCVVSQTLNVSTASAVTINSVVVNSICGSGLGTGSIGVNPVGGTPAYSYSWTGAPTVTTQNITGLVSGTYVLKLTDAVGCVNNYTFNVNAPPAISITASATKSVICNSLSNGSITASASGGSPPLSYTWTPLSPFAGSVTPTVFNLGPGVYSVNAIDANGCTATNAATFALAASTLSSSISQQSATCSNSANASATITVTGGAPTFSFSWSFGTSTTNVIANLGVGNYVGSVIDADGCSSQNSFTVVAASAFTVSLLPSNPKCNGALNGSITTTSSGGVGSITYSWSPSGTGQNPIGLGAGTYTLLAGDSNSCQAIAVTNLINPAQIQANVATSGTVCNAVCNGSAFVSPVNAVGTTSVAWLPSGPNANTITALCAGNYTVTVSDANGCSDSAPFVIASFSPININATSAPPTCGVSNGSIGLTINGGTPGYTYTWTPAVSTGTSAVALTAQLYTVLVKDNVNCTNTIVIPLSNSNGPIANISFTNNRCFGQSIGAASVGVISGGTPPYLTPVWVLPAPSVTANAISGLSTTPGGYSVQLEDNLGCITFTGTNITQPSSITINANIKLPTCNGICNGSISLSTTGGVAPYSYSWSPAAPNTSVLTNLCPNVYTTLVTHNNGSCTSLHTFTIPSQINLTFTDNVIANTCFGSCNGMATVSVINTPGIPSPFAFSWSNGQNTASGLSSSLNGLCNGVYSVTATGANGCFNTYSVNITSPPQLTIATVASQPSCGVCNGSLNVLAGGGSGTSYTYSWSSGANTSSLVNLCAGMYLLNVSDALGCVQSETVILNNSNGISTPTITNQNIPCGATCNGAATVQATSPNLPVSYNWVSPAVSGSVITNLCQGTYFVQLQDAQGCLLTASTAITAATSITIASFIRPPSCGSVSNGAIQLAVSGGSPTYSFAWVPAAVNSGTLNNIGPGSYTVTVSDNSPGGCPTSSVVNVSSVNAPLVNLLILNINCFNACTGAATAIVTGTASPYTYNWNVGGNVNTVSNLCRGVITVTVTDTNTCVALKSVTVTDNPQLQINVPFVTQPACNQCNGAVNINAFGGVAPYTCSWTNGATGTSLANLCAGLYQVQITDSKNCNQTQNVIINNSNGITGAKFSVQNLACSTSCNGAVTVTPVGGTAPIAFAWINPVLNATVNQASNLCAGNYYVQMTDAQGCQRTASTNISAVSNMSLMVSALSPTCNGNNGFINVTVAGGNGPYTYSWTNPALSTPSISNLTAGIYVVTVRDNNGSGCQKTQSVSLNNLSGPSYSYTIAPVACYNFSTGAITVSPNGTNAVSFNWSTGATGNLVANLPAGLVTLTASANGCKTLQTFTVNQNPKLEFHATVTKVSCAGKCDGQVALLPLGGVLIYSFSGNTGISTNLSTNLCAGKYTYTITDQLACVVNDSIRIQNPLPIQTVLNATNSSCASVKDAKAVVVLSGGTPTYSVMWTGPSGFTASQTNLSNVFSGNYTVSVTDNVGCKKDSVLTIHSNIEVDANAGADTTLCNQSTVMLSGAKSTNVFKYTWYQASDLTMPLGNSVTFQAPKLTKSNTYVLVASSSVATCADTDQVFVGVYTEPFLDAGPSFTIPVYSSVTIGGGPTALSSESLTWTPAIWLDNPNTANPLASNTVNVVYTVSISYGSGCLVSDTVRVDVYPEIKVTGGFSPNNDGKNDLWIIDYLDQFPDHEVEIYNRWGDLLFYTKNYQLSPFDGKYKGKNLPVGTYYYIIKLNHPGYPKPYSGPLTIFR